MELEGVTELARLEVGLVRAEFALVVRLGGNDNLAGLRTTTNRDKQWCSAQCGQHLVHDREGSR